MKCKFESLKVTPYVMNALPEAKSFTSRLI